MSSGIERVGVIGGGLMGSGIAEVTARSGYATTVREPTEELAEVARQRLTRSLLGAVKREKLTQAEADAALARLTFVSALGDLRECDLVIEAVPENLGLKREVFRAMDEILAPTAILASNTSSIPIAELASVTGRPDQVLGLHFFSPATVMKLLEMVRALQTSDETLARCRAFADSLQKKVILTKDRAGFIVNMLLLPYLVAAMRMFEEGFATREDIDTGMQLGCAHPMGPLTLADFIGLDVCYEVCNALYEEFKDPTYAPPPLLKRMLAAGYLGRKSGRGFYEYPA
ncbi:MAG: 3-hydroxybutyryl-CoA dehydrogenase [Candidatus Dormibacteria bacterium]